MKKNLLFSATLLCSALLSSTMFANQDSVSTEADELQQGMELLSATYQATIKSYNKSDIEKCEVGMSSVIKAYMLSCAKNKSNAKNISSIEQEVTKTLEFLAATTNKNAALATTGLMFSIVFTRVMENVEAEVTDPKEIENLSEAAEEISKFINKFFMEPMQELAAQQQAQQPVAA